MSITKICMHWTAGSNNPCQTDIDAYHFIFDSVGKEYKGKFAPEDNINCYDGKYAKHCGGGNTGCIGLSCCGMAGFDLKNKQTKYPITQNRLKQCAAKRLNSASNMEFKLQRKQFLHTLNSTKNALQMKERANLTLPICLIFRIFPKKKQEIF